jgi:Mn-containing catalase
MILRVDRLQIELPRPSEPDPPAAAAVQELLGGRFGEMSTLMNYTYQSSTCAGARRSSPTTT